MSGLVRSLRGWLLALAGALALGCSGLFGASEDDESLTRCRDPRPEVCTFHYDPVCARRDDGTRKTYGNACNACSDAAVVGHVAGACE